MRTEDTHKCFHDPKGAVCRIKDYLFSEMECNIHKLRALFLPLPENESCVSTEEVAPLLPCFAAIVSTVAKKGQTDSKEVVLGLCL